MKKIKKANILIVLILVLSLLIILPTITTGAEPAVGDNIVRVHLNSYGAPASFTMNAAGSYTIQNNGQPISGTFTLAASGTGIRLTSGSSSTTLSGDVYIKAGSISAGNLIQINNGYKYAGDMRILNKGGGLKLINHVDIETYVMGVIPYEMTNSWPIEALKAQAIAARSYAYYVMHSKVRTTVEQDLVNSTLHQVYNGYNAANANCIAAVDATKNMIMKTPGGQNVFACYSASNGGTTESGVASGVSSQNFDYLSVKDDPWDLDYALGSATYSSKLTIPRTIAASDLKNSTAQPYKMLRDKLKSSGVDIGTVSGDVTVKSIELTNPGYTGPDRQFMGAKFIVTVNGVQDVPISFGPVTFSGSSTKYPFLNDILGVGKKFPMLALRDDGANWVLASVRYGHGAGLSQVGACQMALNGKNYDDILTFYYGLGSATTLVTMPWDNSGGTNFGAAGYTVTSVNKTGKVNTPGTTLNVRSGPGTGNSVVTSLKDGAKVTITGQVADWWRIDLGGGTSGFVNSGFIKLDSDSQQTTETNPPDPVKPETKTGTVNTPGTTLNVRSAPNTTAAVIGVLKHGEKVAVTDENASWYKLTVDGKTGYVNKAYISLGGSGQTDNTENTTDTSQTKAVYVNTPGTILNVRSGPGTTYAILGSLKHGEKITVTDENASWYKLASITYNNKAGYVSKAYISLSGTTQNQNTPEMKTVYVNTPGTTLNVRSGPGTTYAILGSLKHGDKLTVADENSSWYRLTYNNKAGYISKAYTKADQPAAATPTNPGTTTTNPGTSTNNPGTSGIAQTKTVYVNTPGTTLNVRSGPGTTYAILGSLKHGDKITVADENSSWYRLTFNNKAGYISKSYVTGEAVSAAPSTPAQKTGTVIAPLGLNVRSGPGTNYKVLGGLANGTKITITEQSGDWYKIKYGAVDAWVSLAFVKV